MDKDRISQINSEYWKANLKVVGILLVIWAIVSCLLSIVLVEPLNKIMLGGFPLGFWIAQQGSIITFIILILIYALIMNKIDKDFENKLKESNNTPKPTDDSNTTTPDSGGAQ